MNFIITTLNNLGIHFWQFTIEMFIQSTILIVLLFAIDFFLRKKVCAVFRYFLWLLVLVKLLLIINIASPVGVETWLNNFRPAITEKEYIISSQNFEKEKIIFPQISDPTIKTFSVVPVKKPVIAAQTKLNKLPPLNWQGYLFLGWSIGILIFVVLLTQRLLFIKGLVSQTKNATPELQNLFKECLKTMKLKSKKIKLKISSNMVSPAVCGLFRPTILLPDYLINKLNQQQLCAVLLHELSHIKRYDLPMNFLQTALQIIYFYNPFVWFANNIIRKIREQAVDEAVLVALGHKATEYSNTLIDIAEMAFFRPALGLRLIGVVESKKALSQRIKHIMNRPIPKTAKLSFTGFLIIIIVAVFVLPMAKAEENSNSKLKTQNSKLLFNLQEKINNAQEGEVIIVPERVYTENLIITKPIILRGESVKKSVIKFMGDVPAIFIKKVKNVTIENLTIKWSQKSTDKFLENAAAIAVCNADVLIKNCLLEPIDRPKQTPYGLLVQGKSDVTFIGSQTKGFAYTIMFTDGANGVIRDSFLEGAGHSVVTLHANSKVAIIHNILARCDYHAVRNTGGTMDMKNNLVIDNNRAGTYLGNRSAHGIIENNLFTRNNGAIWAYAKSDVKIINNLFINSKNAAISFRGSCKLKIEKNSFIDNPTALIRYKGKEKSKSSGATIGKNHYWKNKKDNVDLKDNNVEKIISGSPRFNNSKKGDFSVRKESALEKNGNVIAGLTNPNIINFLWKIYTKKTDRKIPEMKVKAFERFGKKAKKFAPENYADELPDVKKILESGNSQDRIDAIKLIGKHRLTSIMDDSFIKAFSKCAKDENSNIRKSVARKVGNRWIWSAKTQNVDAIDLLLELSKDEDRNVRYKSVYFGLSTVRDKSEKIVRRLLEIAFDDRERNMYRRISWGLKRDKKLTKKVLNEYLNGNNPHFAKSAQEIYENMTGEPPPKLVSRVKSKKYSQKEILTHNIDYFFNKLGKWDNEYQYYAAMWALSQKCKSDSKTKKEILTRSRKLFNTSKIENVRIQCMGIAATPEAKDYMEFIVEALHNDNNEQIRKMAAYFLLFFEDKNLISELEKSLKKEKSKIVINSIKATIKRLLPLVEQNLPLSEHKVDNIDLPFVDDPKIIGTWKSVDFVKEIDDFHPEENNYEEGELYLKKLIFYENGRTFRTFWTWTKGVVMHSGSKTAAKYEIKEIDGDKYMFFEWKSGDYTIRRMKPKYYVLKKDKTTN